MKKIVMAGLCAIAFSCSPAKVAQQAPAAAPDKDTELPLKAPKLENSLLWKISGNGLLKPSYLYGTMHITCDASLDETVIEALKYTDQLYLELDMDDPTMQTKMMTGLMMKDGSTLTSLSSREEFIIVDEFVKKYAGMPASMMDKYKPAVIEMMVLPKMLECPIQSVEEELMKLTHQQQEQVLGLETVEEQMALFDAIPYKEQMESLVKTAKEGIEGNKAKYTNLNKIYRSRNLEAIQKFMEAEENGMGKNSDLMLTDRNKKWIPRIEEIAKKTPTFFGVGAAHLPGGDGVIALLRNKGYKVEAVMVETK